MRKYAIGAVAAFATASSAWAAHTLPQSDSLAAPAHPHFDAYYLGSSSRAATSIASNGSGPVYRTQIDAVSGAPTFLFANADRTPAAVGALKASALAEARARAFLLARLTTLRTDAAAIDGARLHDLHDLGRGAVIARFQQRLDGLEVFGRSLNVAMDRDGKLVAISGQFAPSAAVRATRLGRFDFSAAQAVASAFADLGGRIDASALRAGADENGYQTFALPRQQGDYALQQTPRIKMLYFPLPDRLVPAYYIELFAGSADGKRNDAYSYVVSAEDGSLLFRNNLTASAIFTYRMFADQSGENRPFDEPLGNNYAPFTGSSYTATVARTGAASQLVSLNSSPLISTGDPWLLPNAKVTTGNNVDAYLDLSAPDGYSTRIGSKDLRASSNSPGAFNYPLAADTDPATSDAQNSAVVNLFYMNNWLHDFWYNHGFNEAAGNAQNLNYGRGGVSGDPIHAEGQDFSGRNNANMSTPADGRSPRMQMYLFDGLVVGEFTVTAPSSIAGSYDFGVASFGASTYDLTGDLVLVQDSGGTSTTDGCESITNAVYNKIALIDRGSCSFAQKTQAAQDAGAVAAVIVNNVDGGTITMGEDSTYSPTIPAMMVTLADGNTFKSTLSSNTVTVHMRRDPATDLDGTIDEGVIAHEFFHYVSNRLVNNGSGLGNNQGGGMGEGWSDFDTMLLQVRPEDTSVAGNNHFQGAYPVGTYVTGEYYFGIRRTPYSTSFSIDPLTFKHIQNGVALPTTAPIAFGQDGSSNAEVHNTGEVWANMLWEAYAALLNDPRYAGAYTTARSHMQDYVIGGLKLTPPNPTFVDARNGILGTAKAADCQDYLDIAAAFAKRGMGINAVAPPASSTDNVGVVEDYTAPANCN